MHEILKTWKFEDVANMFDKIAEWSTWNKSFENETERFLIKLIGEIAEVKEDEDSSDRDRSGR